MTPAERNEVLEEAAKVAEEHEVAAKANTDKFVGGSDARIANPMFNWEVGSRVTAGAIAAHIRALKRPEAEPRPMSHAAEMANNIAHDKLAFYREAVKKESGGPGGSE